MIFFVFFYNKTKYKKIIVFNFLLLFPSCFLRTTHGLIIENFCIYKYIIYFE